MVCPPETSSTTRGSGRSGSSRKAAYTWASRWLTPTKGTSHTRASALAALMPTSSEPTRPGPTVQATASTSGPWRPASTRASATTGVSSSTWARLATSGTTPPKRACRSTWLDTTEERTSVPSRTTAAAVSSQLVSIPSSVPFPRLTAALLVGFARPRARSLLVGFARPRARSLLVGFARPRARSLFHHRRAHDALLDLPEPLGVRRRVDVVRPHDEGVLPGLGVVPLAHTGGGEPEPAVQLLGRGVPHADLERETAAPPAPGGVGQVQQQAGPDLAPVPGGVDGQGGDVALAGHVHQPRVAHDRRAHLGHPVRAGALHRQLRGEQAQRPRPRVDAALDAQHRAQVAPAHAHDRDLHGRPLRPHQRPAPVRRDQLISASALRR